MTSQLEGRQFIDTGWHRHRQWLRSVPNVVLAQDARSEYRLSIIASRRAAYVEAAYRFEIDSLTTTLIDSSRCIERVT